MAVKKLSDDEVRMRLGGLTEWGLVDAKLHREFGFKDFVEAFGFMARAALVAEEMNHHPEWSNVYNRVEVSLSTHDVGGISEKDFDLARALDRLVG